MKNFIASLFLYLLIVFPTEASNRETINQADIEPLTIDSRDGMQCDNVKQTCKAEGLVFVKKGAYEMFAKKATAFMRKNELGKNEIYRIEAYDDIRIFGIDGETGAGDIAIYDLDKEIIQLKPNGGKLAILWKEDYILKSSLIEIHFKRREDGRSIAEHFDAIDNVVLSSPDELIEGDKAVYTPSTEIIIVTGDVRITNDEGQIRGNYAKVNVDTKFSEMLKRPGIEQDERPRVFVYPENSKHSPGSS